MLFNVKEGKLRISCGEIDYITFGKGEKPLVMIQGLNTNGIKGSGLALALMYRIFTKGGFKVYLFDKRPEITENTTVREMAADIAEAMDLLEIKNAYILGVSQGGMTAQYLAIDRPDLVAKLALAVTLSRNNETVVSVINNWVSLTKKGDYRGLVSDMAEKIYSENYLKKYRPLLPLLTLVQKPKKPERFINEALSCLSCNTYDELEKIKCPTLVIGGKQDKIVGENAAMEIADKLDIECSIYEDFGHAVYEEAADFNAEILNFFTK